MSKNPSHYRYYYLWLTTFSYLLLVTVWKKPLNHSLHRWIGKDINFFFRFATSFLHLRHFFFQFASSFFDPRLLSIRDFSFFRHSLDTTIFKAERFYKGSALDVRTYFIHIETFQYSLSLHLCLSLCLLQLEGTLVLWLWLNIKIKLFKLLQSS